MNKQGNGNSALSGYRVLDLTDEKGMLCSRLLADMDAEVVRVEKGQLMLFPWAEISSL